MADAWKEIQAIQSKRNSLREKLQKRKKERQELLSAAGPSSIKSDDEESKGSNIPIILSPANNDKKPETIVSSTSFTLESSNTSALEGELLRYLSSSTSSLPITSDYLTTTISNELNITIAAVSVSNLLQKFAAQQLLSVQEVNTDGTIVLQISTIDQVKLLSLSSELNPGKSPYKRTREVLQEEITEDVVFMQKNEAKRERKDIMSLLAMPSAKEKENKKLGAEILDLLSKPTAKEKSMAERFRSQGGAQVMEFCPDGTKTDCSVGPQCKKLHFKKILQSHTDESLGDCSFLNTCFHMDTCKYVHYEVDGEVNVEKDTDPSSSNIIASSIVSQTTLYPAQWIQCDLRFLDMTVLGKFAVVMADPPWDIHMELPYGTLSDDEMRQLNIPALQEDGLIFLWVTGRAMELGRECLKLWGYERVDEIIWVKTNQLQRIIRTGRTGHWLNHGKEHCLVGMKGNPAVLNRGLDCDVIVAEVRATSHKPDEIYGIIERLSPGTRKIELFGRPHNVQPNWITLGNQLDGVKLVDADLKQSFSSRYPDGACMGPGKKPGNQ